jgi:hypothetical protein
MKKTAKNDFLPAKQHAVLTTGEVVKMLRELKSCGINAKNISLLENNRLDIGKKRALQLAVACGVHPAIIMFPEYESEATGKAA